VDVSGEAMEEKLHYVYVHLLDGNIRYVGIGRKYQNDTKYTRANIFSPSVRTKEWRAIFKDTKPEVKILEENLEYMDAISLENYIYHSCKENNLANITEPKPVAELDYKYFKHWFYVDETSPSGLRVNTSHKNNQMSNRHDVAGSIATTVQGKSYWRVKANGIGYLAHRVVYLLSYGKISSTKVINHIDGNGLNNSLSNLEEISQELNCYKKKNTVLNNVGIKGASFVKYKGKTVSISAKFCRVTKSFCIDLFGDIDSTISAVLRWQMYQQYKAGMLQYKDIEPILHLLLEDKRKTDGVQGKYQPLELKSGLWSVRVPNGPSVKYSTLTGFSSKIEAEVARDLYIKELNEKLITSLD